MPHVLELDGIDAMIIALSLSGERNVPSARILDLDAITTRIIRRR
jgi:hypothetical protein